MMINREPFIQIHDDDSILYKILANQLRQEKLLQELVSNIPALDFPTTTDILHTLLPQEVCTSHLSEASQVDLTVKVEVDLNKYLNINNQLTGTQRITLVDLLKCHQHAFAWDYKDMHGIDPIVCTHRIYIKEDCRPLRQPQRRINPTLREIVKEELQKLLNPGFIYPISDSQWVSPLVIVPKKGRKWWVCVDYRALNLATRKGHFPLPFMDQVLDSLAGK